MGQPDFVVPLASGLALLLPNVTFSDDVSYNLGIDAERLEFFGQSRCSLFGGGQSRTTSDRVCMCPVRVQGSRGLCAGAAFQLQDLLLLSEVRDIASDPVPQVVFLVMPLGSLWANSMGPAGAHGVALIVDDFPGGFNDIQGRTSDAPAIGSLSAAGREDLCSEICRQQGSVGTPVQHAAGPPEV
ncbi:MAG: hypothetical protein OXI38_11590 [Bacteroidota bacterium]|nr:hypothetical protein [Bacteroidota bacterium]